MDTIERADGSRGTRDLVGHPGAVAILAIDAEEHVLLVRQYRVAIGEALLEIPAGTLDVAEDGTVEDPDLAARRELEEETGTRAGSWRKIATFFTAPGFASELMHLYLATDLRPADGDRLQPDDDEHLEVVRMPWRDALAAAERGRVPRREVACRACSGWPVYETPARAFPSLPQGPPDPRRAGPARRDRGACPG